MLRIEIVNDGTAGKKDPLNNGCVGNYDYKVFVNSKLVGKGRIENYQRLFGWEELINELGVVVSRKVRNNVF